ncbi:L-aspartate oxidase [Pusillimonas sp. TS35]|uniref:L-aspartate oxidase n=1 Tax=Paracandidimonas lactea TaxID=2895524 RepID=UPI00136FB40D|nr:L-aspartate oxidase [Paracandidimonas lactea]MYN12726.1 L-aspartate oxidase [Pusillimonas sp. TS35]
MRYDAIIIGSGLAGLTAALELAPHQRVALIAKGAFDDSASNRAQGGIAAALDPQDSVDEHVRDTLVAGAGLCDTQATRLIAAGAPDAIRWLQGLGAGFSTDDSSRDALDLTREGGHGRRRIVHADDATGRVVVAALAAQARRHPNITLMEHHCAIDLASAHGVRCAGLHVLDLLHGRIATLTAPHVVLATGGAGQVYAHTTTPAIATGDGIAMAWRAGCRVSNMEFIQFHPTSLYPPADDAFLISEAVRGEGGLLRLPDGTRFMPAYDTRAELAPRDIVARAIDREIKRHSLNCVYLDISHRPRDFLLAHFPNIYAHCLSQGIDMATDPIPVVPAAHYTCGGIVTGPDGRTDIPGLYAIGESACTGLHGANRLASNSLLECVVMGRAAAQAIRAQPMTANKQPTATDAPHIDAPAWHMRADKRPDETIAHTRQALRALMSNDVGIVRSNASLTRAEQHIAQWEAITARQWRNEGVSRELLELRNLLQVAALIVRSAITRHESRGAHCNCDWPDTLTDARASVLKHEAAAMPDITAPLAA